RGPAPVRSRRPEQAARGDGDGGPGRGLAARGRGAPYRGRRRAAGRRGGQRRRVRRARRPKAGGGPPRPRSVHGLTLLRGAELRVGEEHEQARASDRGRGRTARPMTGFTVALIGPDGAGKTTVSRRIEQSLPVPVKYIYMGVNTDASNVMLPTTRAIHALKRLRGT